MAATYRLTAWRRGLNAVVRALLRMGLGPRHTYLLSVRGRRTGRLYSTPVTLVEEPEARWLVAPYGEVAWVRNARAAGEVTLARGRRRETVRLGPADARDAGRVLRLYATAVPITRPYFDAAPSAPVAAFEAEAQRHPVFRLVPDPAAATRASH